MKRSKDQTPELGDIVRDKVTGITGTVFATAVNLYNTDQVTIQPASQDGVTRPDHIGFDVGPNIEVVEKGSIKPATMGPLELKLGDEVKDRITGFKGVVVIIGTWLDGCYRVAVQPKGLDKNGKPMESSWFENQRLKVRWKPSLKRDSSTTPTSEKVTTGGPTPSLPSRHKMPSSRNVAGGTILT